MVLRAVWCQVTAALGCVVGGWGAGEEMWCLVAGRGKEVKLEVHKPMKIRAPCFLALPRLAPRQRLPGFWSPKTTTVHHQCTATVGANQASASLSFHPVAAILPKRLPERMPDQICWTWMWFCGKKLSEGSVGLQMHSMRTFI